MATSTQTIERPATVDQTESPTAIDPLDPRVAFHRPPFIGARHATA